MKRELKSITIRYYTDDTKGVIIEDNTVIVSYRLLDFNNNLLRDDIITIYPSTDYSIYEEKIQKFCKIAFDQS